MATEEKDRYGRQNLIVPPLKIKDVDALVVGVGAIGRQVALQLAGIGVPKITLVDMDIVEITNLSSQGYLENQMGATKVFATSLDSLKLNGNAKIHTHFSRYEPYMQGTHVFCCVDSMAARREIFDATEEKRKFFVDGRMGGENVKVLTAYDADSIRYWIKTWFPDSEADTLPCAARSTIYCSNIAAGIMVSQFTKHLRDFWIPPDVAVSLLGMTMTAEVLTPCSAKG